MSYKHLSIDEREVILKMLENSKTLSEIAEKTGRDRSTIRRELKRNRASDGTYKAHLAQKYYDSRRRDSKTPYLLNNEALKEYVVDKILLEWSPEQISNRLKKNKCGSTRMQVSTGTIYRFVRDDKITGGKLYKGLRQGLRKRRKRSGSSDKRGQIPNNA